MKKLMFPRRTVRPTFGPFRGSARVVSAAVAAAVVLASCSGAGGGNASTPEIVVTNTVLASIVREVVGDEFTVTAVIPDGKDPHDYEPSAGDIAKIANADFVVANGFGYEPTLDSAIASARANKVPVFDAEWVLPGLGSRDPHWFTDPVLASSVSAELVTMMESKLGRSLDGPYSSAVAGFGSIADDAEELFAGLRARLAGTGRTCSFGSEHIFLGPFSERFSCPASALLNPGSRMPGSEPSASAVEQFAAKMKKEGVTVLVEDASEPSRVLKRVADETGAAITQVNVHSMGPAKSYRQYVMNIARTITAAF